MFAGHRIDGIAGRGGMGVVYRATLLALDRPVALKLINPAIADSPEFRERFRRESRLAARIEHPNAVPVYHAGEEQGTLYVTMRLVDGVDLGTLLRSRGPLPPAEAARMVADVAAALDAAHALGLVHRDVKPANILVDREGRVFLTDFGLTKRTEGDGLTATGQWVGTLDYVPPEQIRGLAVTARSDVYALGCVLYEALTGSVPFPRGDPAAIVFAHVSEPPPAPSARRPGVPPALDAVVARAMAKAPEDRYTRAGDLGAAACAAAASTEVAPRSTEPASPRPTGAGPAPALTPPTGLPAPPPLAAPAPVPPPRSPGPPPAAPASEPTTPRGAPPRGPARGRRLAVGAAVVAAAFAIGFGAVLLAGDDDPADVGDGTTDTGGGVTTGPGTGTATDGPAGEGCREPLRVAAEPGQMAFGAGAMWVTDVGADRLVRVDLDTCAVTDRIAVGDRPGGVHFGLGTGLWITNDVPAGAVQRVDPETRRVVDRAATGANPKNVAGVTGPNAERAGSAVWTADYRGDSITAVDATTGERRATLALGSGSDPRDIGILRGIWVTEDTRRSVALVNGEDPSAPRVVRRIALQGTPNALATSTIGGVAQIWVTDRDDGITRIDAGTGLATRLAITPGDRPTGITAGAGRIWVALTGVDRVVAFDHVSGRPVVAVPTPARPFSVALDDRARVWALTRRGLLVQVTGPEGARLS